MDWSKKIDQVQQKIAASGWDGWLLYDFRKTNDLACKFLGIPEEALATRRFFYWIPRKGKPIKVAHRIEPSLLSHLPGDSLLYSSWGELEERLGKVLSGAKTVCMEYSPGNRVPTVSKVDAGTMETVRAFGINVVSSADLLQEYTCVWTPRQYRLHEEAAQVLQEGVERAWEKIVFSLKHQTVVTEYDIQKFLLDHFEKNGCSTDAPPICALNAHSADPHFSPSKEGSAVIKKGDFILIDVWCKRRAEEAVYADITRVAVAAEKPSARQKEVFDAVGKGRDAALALIRDRLSVRAPIRGWEVDRVCRDAIIASGYGENFTHRTGHSIGERDHGDGANIDDFETKEERLLLPGTCFSIEPGIYLPGEFGVRLEDDVYLDPNGTDFRLTKGMQKEIECLF